MRADGGVRSPPVVMVLQDRPVPDPHIVYLKLPVKCQHSSIKLEGERERDEERIKFSHTDGHVQVLLFHVIVLFQSFIFLLVLIFLCVYWYPGLQ